MLAGAIIQERNNIVDFYAQAGPITLALNVVMLALAWLLASLFGGGGAVIPAATYSLTMFATALVLIYFLRRRVVPEPAAS